MQDDESKVVIVIILAIVFIGMTYKVTHPDRPAQKKDEAKVEAVTNKAESIKPLEKLMPKFEVVTNSDRSYQIRFMAYDKTNWTYVTNIFENSADAQWTIAMSQVELELKYRVLKGIAEDIKNIKP